MSGGRPLVTDSTPGVIYFNWRQMKACCKVGDEPEPSKFKKALKMIFWGLLMAMVLGLAMAEVIDI